MMTKIRAVETVKKTTTLIEMVKNIRAVRMMKKNRVVEIVENDDND